jgi:hypothetical protein
MSTEARSMSSSRAFTSQFTSSRIGGSGSLRPGGKAMRPCSISERALSPNVSRTPRARPASICSITAVRLPNSA